MCTPRGDALGDGDGDVLSTTATRSSRGRPGLDNKCGSETVSRPVSSALLVRLNRVKGFRLGCQKESRQKKSATTRGVRGKKEKGKGRKKKEKEKSSAGVQSTENMLRVIPWELQRLGYFHQKHHCPCGDDGTGVIHSRSSLCGRLSSIQGQSNTQDIKKRKPSKQLMCRH